MLNAPERRNFSYCYISRTSNLQKIDSPIQINDICGDNGFSIICTCGCLNESARNTIQYFSSKTSVAYWPPDESSMIIFYIVHLK